MNRPSGLVLVGGSYAAVGVIEGAREAGYQEPITLLSAESHLPYQRPPLSKGFLSGAVDEGAITLRSADFYRDNGVNVQLEVRASALDLSKKRVFLETGGTVPYGSLALVMGARARDFPVPGANLDGVFALRSLDDARAVRARLAAASEIVIIGGGYIGLEVAASLATLGRSVVVIEREARLLRRSVSHQMSEFIGASHLRNGVQLVLAAQVARISGDEGGRVRTVELEDGRRYPADVVIVGVGAVPNAELADAAGLACHDGILVDASARTSALDVVAAGDCTRHPNRFGRGLVRLESVQHATEQGRVAGAVIAGRRVTYDTPPWFWSSQYTHKLQIAGLVAGYDQTELRGSPEDGRFSLYHYARGVLVAVESVNRPADHMAARRQLLGA
ncbi:MAG TPA: FAD-dependent oxidoreductase [Steroidobacteraceae bacterium]|nr:FAD-dependent oxidoreductase [Steroidobacteraceae bacterium]